MPKCQECQVPFELKSCSPNKKYCSVACYRTARLKRGWFKGVREFTEKRLAHVSRSKTFKERKSLRDNYMEIDKSISWRYIYNKKQYGEMMKEYYNKKEGVLNGRLIE